MYETDKNLIPGTKTGDMFCTPHPHNGGAVERTLFTSETLVIHRETAINALTMGRIEEETIYVTKNLTTRIV